MKNKTMRKKFNKVLNKMHSKCMIITKCLFVVSIMVSIISCSNYDEDEPIKPVEIYTNETTDNAIYYVQYTASYRMLTGKCNASYTYVDANRNSVTKKTYGGGKEIIGPVKKGFRAHITSGMGCARASAGISVSKNGNEYVQMAYQEKSRGASVSYTIDF